MVNLFTFDPDHCTDADARDVQRQLAAAGYYHDEIDGQFWSISRAALDHWKIAHAGPVAGSGASNALQQSVLTRIGRYNGLTEIVDNNRWAFINDPDRTIPDEWRAGLVSVGWQSPWAYCAAGIKLVWRQAFAQVGADFSQFSKLLTLGAVESFTNCRRAKLTTQQPKVGALFFMQHGETSLGHAGIVRGIQGKTLLTWEANTGASTTDPNRDREGDMVTFKTRAFDFTQTSGLHLLGCVNLPAI